MKIAVTATFTSEPLRESLTYLLTELGMAAELEFAPYGQLFQQLADPSSLISGNRRGVNVLLIRLEDWAGMEAGQYGAGDLSSARAVESVTRNVTDFLRMLEESVRRCPAPHVVCVCEPSAAALRAPDAASLCTEMDRRLTVGVGGLGDVHLVTTSDLRRLLPVEDHDDPAANRLGHVPYTPEYFAALGGLVARRIYRITSAPHKVVVLDCDQTLWSGVCGEVGPLGVEIDPPRRALQDFMVEQHRSGMVLCLCSKNNEADVFQVFDGRPEMPLRREHLVSWRINWGPKSENLRSLAGELRLGLDSFIFVDDDPVVCAEVRANCPEVLTLQLPSDVERIPRFLQHVWAFDHLKLTREDEQRSRLYRENLERERLRDEAGGFDHFIASLGLEISIAPMQPEHVARVSQLTQRTNQFNFTTIRRSESEVQELCAAGGGECVVVQVRDRFGDYGLVGVVIYRELVDALEVDSFLLSCRALGRGVEHRMLAHLGETARRRGLARVACRLLPTERNQPAREFLHAVGSAHAEPLGPGLVYHFPADVAAALTFTGTSARAEASPTEERGRGDAIRTHDGPSPSVPRSSNDTLNRIANELHGASLILDACRPPGRRPSPGPAEGEPPRDATEARLAGIWAAVLRVPAVGRDSDFFDLGGDSLLGVQLFSEIESAFGRQLPLAALFETPTVAGLASRLQADAAPRWSPLVPIKPGGSRPPLYCMHAAGGNVLFYRDLAAHLDADQPVYGLQARGLDRTQTHHDRVEDMAACYLAEIRALQPEGPYHLGGSSFGGLVAYEMARQLHAEGQRVGLLAVFDTYGPGYPTLRPGTSSLWRALHEQAHRVERVVDNLRALDGRGRLAYLWSRLQRGERALRRRVLWKKNEFELKFSAATGRALPPDLRRNHAAIQRALQSYRPPPFDGSMVVFRASKQPYGAVPDPTLGWSRVVRGTVETHEVPGAHGAVTVDPYARFLAQKLTPCLHRAQAAGATTALEAATT